MRRGQDELQVGLGGTAKGDPALPVRADVVADFQAEHVAVERERLVEVIDGDL
ncbi:hypothetical protein D3C85_1941800 [compost metagenome]